METVEEILKASRVDTSEGFLVILPEGQLDRKLYVAVNNRLELIGGKWSRKLRGHVFESDPRELLGQVTNGDKRNLKKEFQFFETPEPISAKVIEHASYMIRKLQRQPRTAKILEPSAGRGALCKAIHNAFPGPRIEAYELMEVNRTFLSKLNFVHILGNNFMESPHFNQFDLIIANPPFAKNQDLDHVRHMFDCLRDGGTLFSIMSRHWLMTKGKKEEMFVDWFERYEGEVLETFDYGAFKSSDTMVATVLVTMTK